MAIRSGKVFFHEVAAMPQNYISCSTGSIRENCWGEGRRSSRITGVVVGFGRYRLALRLSLCVLCVIGWLFFKVLSAERSSPREREIESELMALYPTGVSVSPHNTFLLLKRRNPRSFDLLVRDLRSGGLVAESSSANTQLALTWAPDESAVFFLENDDASDALTVRRWRLNQPGGPESLGISTLSAKMGMRAAPSGNALLLYRGNGDRGDVTVVRNPLADSPTISSLGTMLHGGDFRWSPDGGSVAFTPDFASGRVDIVDGSTGTLRKSLSLPAGSSISSLAWGNDAEVYVTARPPGEEFYSLFRADVVTGAVTSVLRTPYDLQNPVVDGSGKRFAIEANRQGRSEVLVGSTAGQDQPASVTLPETSVRIIGASSDHSVLHVQGGPLNHSPTVFVMDWGGTVRTLGGQADVAGSTPATVNISTADGQRVPTILWSGSPGVKNVRRGIVYVHGGPHLQERPILDGRVLPSILRNTVVAIPNYRGSSGFGATWEAIESTEAQALDIKGVLDYLKGSYGLSSDKIVVVTSSTGARSVLRMLKDDPNAFGTLVLTALIPVEPSVCAASKFEGAVYGFHGSRDLVFSPQEAQQVFQACSRSARKSEFRVFPREGHLFHRTSSWAAVFAATLG